MQPDVIGVEASVVPLERGAGAALLVIPVIVDAHGNHIGARFKIWREEKKESHYSVFVAAGKMSVEIYVHCLAGACKFDEHLLPACGFGESEMLAVPCY